MNVRIIVKPVIWLVARTMVVLSDLILVLRRMERR